MARTTALDARGIPDATDQPRPTDPQVVALRWAVAWGIVVLVGVAVVATQALGYLPLPAPNVGFRDAASVLAVVTGLAVGIERGLEAFWTGWEALPGDTPVEPISLAVNRAIEDLGETAGPFLQRAQDAVAGRRQGADRVEKDVAEAEARLAELTQDLTRLQSYAPGNPQVLAFTQLVQKGVAALETYDPAIARASAGTNRALGVLSELLASTTENPGRRLVSLMAGTFLGLVIAAAFGLDLFAASLGDAPSWGRWGIVVTGLVAGLGANPTHEVIRAVQEYKEKQKERA